MKSVELSGTKIGNIQKKIDFKPEVAAEIPMDLYRCIHEFKKHYQTRNNLVKFENGDLVAYSHSILKRRNNYGCQLLNMHGAKDVKLTEMHTLELLIPKPSSFKVKISVGELNRYKWPGTNQIPAELIKA
jgi:hypothetical protein